MKFKTKEEFELYALMYVASLDFKLTKEELSYMSKGVAAETYQYVSDMFQADNDAETVVYHLLQILRTRHILVFNTWIS